ncbi:MAG: hypothetical protein J5I53_01035 [Bradyrhizobiaceae bacterium]|nr:hypothetical protein [Bradyrhizobiaceae bacterium]
MPDVPLLAWLPIAISAGILFAWAMSTKPKVWLGTVVLLLPVFLADTGVGLSVSEAIVAGLIIGSSLTWAIAHLAVGKRLIRSWADFFVVAFIVLSATNFIVAVCNEGKLDRWLFEWMLFLIMFLYFPLREVFGQDRESLKQLLVLCAITTVGMLAFSIYEWTHRSSGILIYAYQLIDSRSRLFAPVFVFALAIGIPMYFHVRRRSAKLALFLCIFLNLAGLAQSMTRSLWGAFAVSLALTIPFLSLKENFKLLVTSLAIAAAVYGTAMVVAPRITELAVKLTFKRLGEASLSGGDYSFETRTNEIDVIWRDIKRFPLSGSGVQAQLLSWDPIVQFHWRKSFVHIGYAGLLFKVGAGLTLLMMAMLVAFSIQSTRLAIKYFKRGSCDPLLRSLAIGVFAFQPVLYSFILVAGFFDQRYGMAILAIMFAFIGILTKLLSRPQPPAMLPSPLQPIPLHVQ